MALATRFQLDKFHPRPAIRFCLYKCREISIVRIGSASFRFVPLSGQLNREAAISILKRRQHPPTGVGATRLLKLWARQRFHLTFSI